MDALCCSCQHAVPTGRARMQITASLPAGWLSNMRRYAVVPTPLSRLSFWRLVLDEAQLAGGTGKAAEMAQHVRAQHRWAITGECWVGLHYSLL
jgi:hypothetical protein